MEVITTHILTDFDGLASMVAAKKLYPGALLVLPGKASRSVEEFLALHKDALLIEDARNINLAEVRRLIIVDTRNPRRIGNLGALVERADVEVHLYDHHPGNDEDIRGTVEVVEPLGATTTLLVEKVREAGLELSSFEATVLALGIYEDTGNLLYPSTTRRDVAAVEFLLACGANLTVVAKFLDRPLTPEQKELLKELILNADRYLINGLKILITWAQSDDFFEGLATLTHKLVEIEQLDVVFSIVAMGDRVYVTGRSSLPDVDVRKILERFGGGGHPAAAAAVVKRSTVEQVKEQLLVVLRELVRAPLSVAEIMTSPVKTVFPETTIAEAGRIMLRYGHSGLPVVRDGRLVGIISRRDIEKAQRSNLAHAPVKAFMSHQVVTVEPSLPVSEAQTLMIEHDIGRLPVVEGGRLVGIISRTDILRTLHPDFKPPFRPLYNQPPPSTGKGNIAALLRSALAPGALRFLERVGAVARELGGAAFLAGEAVRDILLGLKPYGLLLIVEGEALQVGAKVAAELALPLNATSRRAQALVSLGDRCYCYLTEARPGFFEYAFGVPVNNHVLHQELYRHDFTINALAVDLDPERFGQVVDYFGGQNDLQYGLVRVLHNRSFVEEPLRILRAVWLAERFNFQIERQTSRLLREAVQNGLLSRVSPQDLWREVRPYLEDERAPRFLGRCAALGIWPYIFPVASHWEVEPVLTYLPQALKTLESWGIVVRRRWLAYFIAAVHWANPPSVQALCARYRFGGYTTAKVVAAISRWQELLGKLTARGEVALLPLAEALLDLPREAYPLLYVLLSEEGYQERYREVLSTIYANKPRLTGKDIKEMGYAPGPVYREVVDAVWRARLRGLVSSREEEIAFARSYLSGRGAKERESVV